MPKRSLAILTACATISVGISALALNSAAGQQAATPQQSAAGQRGPSASQHALDIGQFPPYKPARLRDGDPALKGDWQSVVSADWDLQDHEAQSGPKPEINGVYGAGPAGQSIIEGGEIPYRPEALAKKKKNFETRAMVDVSNDKTWHNLGDPEMKCYMPGVPRANYLPYPFRIVQSAGGSSTYMLISYEYASATRIIRMNSKEEAP